MGFEWVSGVGGGFESCGGLGWRWGRVWWEIVCGDGGGGGVVCLRYGGGAPHCEKLRFARGRLNKATFDIYF